MKSFEYYNGITELPISKEQYTKLILSYNDDKILVKFPFVIDYTTFNTLQEFSTYAILNNLNVTSEFDETRYNMALEGYKSTKDFENLLIQRNNEFVEDLFDEFQVNNNRAKLLLSIIEHNTPDTIDIFEYQYNQFKTFLPLIKYDLQDELTEYLKSKGDDYDEIYTTPYLNAKDEIQEFLDYLK